MSASDQNQSSHDQSSHNQSGQEDMMPLAFRPFIQELERFCRTHTYDDLVETILNLAAEEPPDRRRAFLARIKAAGGEAAREVSPEALLENIRSLCQEVRARREALRDGSFWETYAFEEETSDRPYRGPYDVPALTPAQESTVLAHVSEADALFRAGRVAEARQAYELLLGLFAGDPEEMQPTPYDFPAGEATLREVRARYARTVYLTEPESNRAPALVEALQAHERGILRATIAKDNLPTMSDVVDAARAELPGVDRFLASWKETLASIVAAQAEPPVSSAPWAVYLYLESIELTEGILGLSSVARRWGTANPYGYVFWVNALERRERWADVASAAREALSELSGGGKGPGGKPTAPLAAALITAGNALGDPAVVLEGRRARFRRDPSKDTLTSLLRIATRMDRLEHELAGALEILRKSGDTKGRLYAIALVLAGRLSETLELTSSTPALGWSDERNAAGFCFAAFLTYRVTRTGARSTAAQELLKEHVAGDAFPIETGEPTAGPLEEGQPDDRAFILYDQVVAALARTQLPPETAEEYLRWAERIGRRRVDNIVANKHRGAYYRAALTLTALSEHYAAGGDSRRAEELVTKYRTKYNRHHAFKRELAQALEISELAGS